MTAPNQQSAPANERHPNCIHPLCGCAGTGDCRMDPMNTPLPCDVKVGATTFRKGVRLGTFVMAAQRWHREAFPDFYTLTEEEKAANLARLQGLASSPQAPAPAAGAPTLTDDEVDEFYDEWEFAEEDPGRIEFHNLVREVERRLARAALASPPAVPLDDLRADLLAGKWDWSKVAHNAAPPDDTIYRAMVGAHTLCPTDMPHLDRMRWMARYIEGALLSAQPKPAKGDAS